MEEVTLDRRSVLQSGSVLSSLAVFGSGLAAGDDDDRIADSDEPARTVEGGLELFATKWDALGGAITQTKFGRFVASKTFNCHVADTGRAYSLELGPAGGAALSPGRDPSAHATLLLSEEDWLAVLYGEYSPVVEATPVDADTPHTRTSTATSFGLNWATAPAFFPNGRWWLPVAISVGDSYRSFITVGQHASITQLHEGHGRPEGESPSPRRIHALVGMDNKIPSRRLLAVRL